MKKFLSVILSFVMLLSALSFCAAALPDETCGEGLTWTLSEDGVLTISGKGAMRDFPFDEMLYAPLLPWAGGLRDIKKIVVKSGVTSISNYAFYNACNVETVELPSTVTSIGKSAFQFTLSLESISLPSKLKSIGDSAFHSSGITSLNIPGEVISVGDSAFMYCYELERVTVPASVLKMGRDVFSGCPCLGEIVNNSLTVSAVENSVFFKISDYRISSMYGLYMKLYTLKSIQRRLAGMAMNTNEINKIYSEIIKEVNAEYSESFTSMDELYNVFGENMTESKYPVFLKVFCFEDSYEQKICDMNLITYEIIRVKVSPIERILQFISDYINKVLSWIVNLMQNGLLF